MTIPTDRLPAEALRRYAKHSANLDTKAMAAELLALRDATSMPGYTRLVAERDAARDALQREIDLRRENERASDAEYQRLRADMEELRTEWFGIAGGENSFPSHRGGDWIAQQQVKTWLADREAARAEAEKLRAELAAIRGRDAKPFDWDGVPTVEEWIAENLREREPRAGSVMVELHPDEVVAYRGESRRVAGWLKDLLAELATVKRQRDELREWCSQQRAEWLVGARTDPAKAVRTGCAAVACAFSEVLEKLDALAAEQPKPQQPKPVAWPHLPEVDRPASEVQP